MTAEQFEKEVDKFFDIAGAVLLDMIKFCTIYLFFMSPLILYFLVGFNLHLPYQVVEAGGWVWSLVAIWLSVLKWKELAEVGDYD